MNELPPIRIGLSGDVMLGRLVAECIEAQGHSYPWGDLLNELQRFDLLLVNLEMALTDHDRPEPKRFNFRARPHVVRCLAEAGVDICAVANNHIRDFGLPGMIETLAVLDHAGIAHAGAGKDLVHARAVATRTVRGRRVSVLSATDNEPDWAATAHQAGVFALDWNDPEPVLAAVAESARTADLTILSLHWGPNMRDRPTERFIDFAHRAINTGARVIHGHSAHVLQGVEFYQNGVILYDCGDFIDDYAVDPRLRNDRALLIELSVSQSGQMSLRGLPTQIQNMQVNCAEETARQWIANRFAELCGPFGTLVRDEGRWLAIYGSE